MGQRRMTRADMPPDPASVVRALRACREAMSGVQARVRPSGPVYHGAAMVMAAIDGFATLLTGEHYFYADGSTTSTERQAEIADKRAREDGEKPWEP